MSAIAYALGGFTAGVFLSYVTMVWVTTNNRRTEHRPNQAAPVPSANEMSWHVVHIRDDIGSACSLLTIANGLLAAIIAILLLPMLPPL